MGLRVQPQLDENSWRHRHNCAVDELIALYHEPGCQLKLSDISMHLIMLANALRQIQEKIENL